MATSPQPGEQLFSLVRAWLHNEPGWRPPEESHSALWALARRHGVDGMVGALAERGAEIPAAFRGPALEVYVTNSLRFRRAEALCVQLRTAAREAALPLGFVKGPALAPAYGDDGVRGFGDIDVLVADGAAGRKLAEMCGLKVVLGERDVPRFFWERAQNIGRVQAEGSHFEVEFTNGSERGNQPLHRILAEWPDRFLLPPDSGDPFPVPPPHAHGIFLLHHLAQHWLNRLIWVADIALVMRMESFDADWLEQAAERLEMRKLLRAVTGFCRRHLDETLPELGRGRVGWKDGLYLSMLAPETFSRTILNKHRHTALSHVTDGILVALQHVLITDLEHPSMSRRRRAPDWTVAKLQYVLAPNGPRLDALLAVAAPLLFVWMTVLVWVVFGRTPRGFARAARRSLSEPDLDLSRNTPKHRVDHHADT